jgi:hypothetical protein
MSNSTTEVDPLVTEALNDTSNALILIHKWKREIDEKRANGDVARDLAARIVDRLSHTRLYEHRGAPRDPLNLLRYESPDLVDALGKLAAAIAKAVGVAREACRNSRPPESWSWFAQLQKAYDGLSALVQRWAELTDCERDCLEVIRKAGRRLNRNSVIQALKEAGKVHGVSTINNALSKLVRIKLLVNSRGRSAKGYGLPERAE